MSEETGFLQAILAAPREEGLRLVYADWLEERATPGDSARAEFIRLSLRQPDRIFWPPAKGASGNPSSPVADRAAELFREHWSEWLEQLRHCLAGSPLCRWLGGEDCRFGYRRGLVAVFVGTQQVVLDAWDDLFRLGPVEEVIVQNLWHFGTVLALRQFLDQPSLRVLRLHAAELREDCVSHLQKVSDWLYRLDRVELFAVNPTAAVARRLVAWLAAKPSRSHIHWQQRAVPAAGQDGGAMDGL